MSNKWTADVDTHNVSPVLAILSTNLSNIGGMLPVFSALPATSKKTIESTLGVKSKSLLYTIMLKVIEKR